jgi:hypothetical protein
MTKGLRILALLVLALGITSLTVGVKEKGKLSNRFKKEILGKYPKETKLYIYGGIAMIVAGAGILGISFFRRKR